MITRTNRGHARSALAVLLTAAALALASGTPAQAVPDDRTASIRGFLARYGADEATQDRLLAEYRGGGVWDSMSSSKQPVSTRSYTETDGAYTVGTYPDGSIAVTRFEVPDPTASDRTRGISGCGVSGKVYTNCRIDMWVGAVQLAFRASYNLGTNQVTNAYGAEYTILGACGASSSITRPAGNIARADVRPPVFDRLLVAAHRQRRVRSGQLERPLKGRRDPLEHLRRARFRIDCRRDRACGDLGSPYDAEVAIAQYRPRPTAPWWAGAAPFHPHPRADPRFPTPSLLVNQFDL